MQKVTGANHQARSEGDSSGRVVSPTKILEAAACTRAVTAYLDTICAPSETH